MKESRLSYEITLCQYVGSISEQKGKEVLEWIQEELGCNNLNQLLIKIFTKSKQLFTNDNLEKLSSRIIYNNNNNNNNNGNHRGSSSEDESNQNSDQNTLPLSKLPTVLLPSIDVHHSPSVSSHNSDQNTFPLLKLPTVLLPNIALCLNQKQLLSFEQCNRELYQVINNIKFLSEYRGFKTLRLTNIALRLTNKSFDKISNERIDCYKYCAANEFDLDLHDDDRDYWNEEIKQKFSDMIDLFCRRKIIRNRYYSDWMSMMFKSITVLKISADAMVLCEELPIELLFEKECKLTHVKLSGELYDENTFASFGSNFKGYFIEDDNINTSKILDTLECDHISPEMYKHGLKFINAKHLCIGDNSIITAGCLDQASLYQPNLTTLTVHGNSKLITIFEDDTTTYQNISSIKTLRLMSYEPCKNDWYTTLNRSTLMTKLGFESNLKNIIFHCNLFGLKHDGKDDSVYGIISNILKKQHFFGLKNVFILFQVMYPLLEVMYPFVERFYGILKKNIDLLKNQFKQLNFGLVIGGISPKWHTWKWNKNINKKFLDQKQQEWKDLCTRRRDETIDRFHENVYWSWKNQIYF